MAVLITFLVTTTPATGVLAAITDPAVPAGSVLPGIEADPTPTPASEPTPVPEVTAAPAATPDPTAEPTPTPDPTADPGPTPSPTAEPTPTPDPTTEPTPTADPTADPASVVVPPTPPRTRVVDAARRPARLWSQLRRGLTVRGRASWYSATLGYAGVAHVAMPGARYLARGLTAPRARVCAAGRCTIVRVVDWCGCYARTPRARIADLSLATLRRLRLDPSRGVYRVKVTLIRPRG